MSDESTNDATPSRADQLADELRAFTDAELAELDGLARELQDLRASRPAPTFDRGAIWSVIEQRLATAVDDPEPPDGRPR